MSVAAPLPSFGSFAQVRAEVDQIDREIVQLIGRRALCVKAAAQFKKDEKAVAAPERFAAMLVVRREWAESEGLDPDMLQDLYRNMVTRFIAEENFTGVRSSSAVPTWSI